MPRRSSAFRSRARRHGAYFLSAVVLALATLLLRPQSAAAHSELVSSDPPNGATLAAAPRRIELIFSEEVAVGLSSVRLVEGNGAAVPGTKLLAPDTSTVMLTLAVPALPGGTYGVLWRVLAEDDGHTTSGVVVFHVGVSTVSTASTLASPGAGQSTHVRDVAVRWLHICLLAAVIGAFAVGAFVLRETHSPQVGPALPMIRRRLTRLGMLSAASCAVVGVAQLALRASGLTAQSGSVSSAAADVLSDTRWGAAWIAQQTALVMLVPALALVARGRTSRRITVVVAALIGCVVVAEAFGSHAAGARTQRGLTVAADAVHTLCGCLWLGALVALVVLLGPRPGDGIGRRDMVRDFGGRFSTMVAASFALVLVTGIYGVGQEVASAGGLTNTTYGRALLIKVGLLVALGVIGLVNSAHLHAMPLPWRRGILLSDGPSRRLVVVEAAVGAVLLIAAATLAESAPPSTVLTVQSAQPMSRAGTAADLTANLKVTPNLPGRNGLSVTVASSNRPPPAPIDRVALRVSEGGGFRLIALRSVAADEYFATARLVAGDVHAELLVTRAGREIAVPVVWTVAQPPRPGGNGRLSSATELLAGGLLVMFVCAGTVLAWRRRIAPRADADRETGHERAASELELRR